MRGTPCLPSGQRVYCKRVCGTDKVEHGRTAKQEVGANSNQAKDGRPSFLVGDEVGQLPFHSEADSWVVLTHRSPVALGGESVHDADLIEFGKAHREPIAIRRATYECAPHVDLNPFSTDVEGGHVRGNLPGRLQAEGSAEWRDPQWPRQQPHAE